MRVWSPRRFTPAGWAATAAIALGGACLVAVAAATPWRPLPGSGPSYRPDPAADFTGAEMARERSFHAAVHPPAYLSIAAGLVVAAGLAFTPVGSRLVGAVGARVRGRSGRERWWAGAVVGAGAVLLVVRVASIGLDAWSEAVQRHYGLSTRTWGGWLADQGKSAGLAIAVGAPLVLVVVATARRLPRWWWAPLAVVGAGFVVVASFAYPVVVEPLFGRFHSLPAGPLRADLLQLAHSDGVDVKDVLVADASRRTTSLNAYVSGFGASRRIVLYDTLLSQPPEQIRSVVAHELGHAKRNDVLTGTLIGALGFGAGVCLLGAAVSSRRLRRLAGVDGPADPRVAALLIGAVSVASFATAPVQNLVSRHIEARADVHSLDLTRDPAGFIRMDHALSVRGLSTLRPNPVAYGLFFTHPASPERIATARTWALRHHVPVPSPLVPGAVLKPPR